MKKTLIYLSLAVVSLTACTKSLLNITDPGNFTPQAFYKTQTDMDGAVLGAYGKLRALYTGFLHYWGECRSDNTSFFNPSVDKNNVDLFTPLALNFAPIETLWVNAYNAIIAANAVLAHVDGAVYTSDDVKKQHIGEASFIRALAYFHLVRNFGGAALNGQLLGVPKVTQALGAAEARSLPRASLEDIYALIVADLTTAKSNLPASTSGSNAGRFTSVAAQALLGKVYMFMAGYPLNKGAAYYTLALNELKPVAENTALILVPSYIQLFNNTNKNTSEGLVEIQFQSNISKGTGNVFESQMLTSAAAAVLVPAGDNGSADNKPTPSILNAYAAGDPRKSVTFRPGYKQASGVYKAEAYGHKYWQSLGKDVSDVDAYTDWNCNWKELRLAEVYLLYAEAVVRTGGDRATALLYVNKVRARARNTNKTEDPTIVNIETQFPTWNPGDPAVSLKDYVTGDFASDDDLLLAIENETRVELGLENNRWYYLVRTKRAPAVMAAELAADNSVNLTWTDRDYAIPIPQTEMQNAPGALIQNAGYTQL